MSENGEMRALLCPTVIFALALSCGGDDSLPSETPSTGGGSSGAGGSSGGGGATAGTHSGAASGSNSGATAGSGGLAHGGSTSGTAGTGGTGGSGGTAGVGGTGGAGFGGSSGTNSGATGGATGGAGGVVNPCMAMPATLQWESLDAAPFSGSAAWAIHQGNLHILPYSGLHHFSYNFADKTWAENPPPPAWVSTLVSDDNNLYAFASSAPENMVPSVYKWDEVVQQWQSIGDVPTPRNIPAVVTNSGTSYFIGDVWFENATVNTVSRYVTQSNQWLQDTTFPIQADCAGATESGEIFAFGTASQLNPTRTVLLDTASMTWTERAPMPASRGYATMLSRKDHFWLIGGSQNAGYADGTFIYSPSADAWCDGPLLPATLARAIVFEHDGFVYVLAGHQSSLSDSDSFWKAPLAAQ